MSARVDLEVKSHLEAMHRELVALVELTGDALECGDKSPNEKAVTSHRTPNRVLAFDADCDDEEILQPRRLSLRVF